MLVLGETVPPEGEFAHRKLANTLVSVALQNRQESPKMSRKSNLGAELLPELHNKIRIICRVTQYFSVKILKKSPDSLEKTIQTSKGYTIFESILKNLWNRCEHDSPSKPFWLRKAY